MRIEVLCLNMITSIVNHQVPHIEMVRFARGAYLTCLHNDQVSRNAANALLEGQTKRLGKRKTKRSLRINPVGFARSTKVLSLTHELLCKKTLASLREGWHCSALFH